MTIDIPDEIWNKANEWFVSLIETEDSEKLWPGFQRWWHAAQIHRVAFRAVERVNHALVDLGILEGPPTD